MIGLILLVSGAVLGIWLFRAFDRAVVSFVGTMAALVGGWRPDPWPRGVHEEDRDRPWGRPETRAPGSGGMPPPSVQLTKVRGFVSAR